MHPFSFMPQIVLYQPDFPHNLGAILRLGACFGLPVHVIEPCGFPLDDKRIRNGALDYGGQVDMRRHASWEHFEAYRKEVGGRLVLASTKAATSLYTFEFEAGNWLLFGRESTGIPESIYTYIDTRVKIPMSSHVRSFNVAMACGIIVSEALRQIQVSSLPA